MKVWGPMGVVNDPYSDCDEGQLTIGCIAVGTSDVRIALLSGVTLLLLSFSHAPAQRATPITQQEYHTHYPAPSPAPLATKAPAAPRKPS